MEYLMEKLKRAESYILAGRYSAALDVIRRAIDFHQSNQDRADDPDRENTRETPGT